MNLLIGDASSYKAIVIAKYLKKNYDNINIIGFDKSNILKIIHSKYFDIIVNWDINLDASYEKLKNIIDEYSIDLMLPVNSNDLTLIMKNKYKLLKVLNYLGDLEAYEILNNKDKLNYLAKDLEIKVPQIYNNFESASIPFVIKPKNLSSSKGVKYIFTQKEKEEYDNDLIKDMLFQEYIEGEGVGYSLFAKNGMSSIGYGHIRIAEYPVSGGSSVLRKSYNNSTIKLNSERIIKKLNWSGFVMFEYKLAKNGEVYLIEANPRIWGSINQGLQNKINYFEDLFGRINNNDLQMEKDVDTYLSPLLYFSLIQYILKFKFKPITNFISNFKNSKADVSFFNDPIGYISIFTKFI